MEQGFTATVVRIEQQTEEIFLIELESAALKHESPFERISARLSLDQTGASGGEKDKQRGGVDRTIVAPPSEDTALIWY
ncbi:MAG: hypothetical protein JO170_17375 [Verrucomicrobia bacterium]|nr:hypothetical protein [Verrucomicrobiota bacterium]